MFFFFFLYIQQFWLIKLANCGLIVAESQIELYIWRIVTHLHSVCDDMELNKKILHIAATIISLRYLCRASLWAVTPPEWRHQEHFGGYRWWRHERALAASRHSLKSTGHLHQHYNGYTHQRRPGVATQLTAKHYHSRRQQQQQQQ